MIAIIAIKITIIAIMIAVNPIKIAIKIIKILIIIAIMSKGSSHLLLCLSPAPLKLPLQSLVLVQSYLQLTFQPWISYHQNKIQSN